LIRLHFDFKGQPERLSAVHGKAKFVPASREVDQQPRWVDALGLGILADELLARNPASNRLSLRPHNVEGQPLFAGVASGTGYERGYMDRDSWLYQSEYAKRAGFHEEHHTVVRCHPAAEECGYVHVA
jgi:hypothetical protein